MSHAAVPPRALLCPHPFCGCRSRSETWELLIIKYMCNAQSTTLSQQKKRGIRITRTRPSFDRLFFATMGCWNSYFCYQSCRISLRWLVFTSLAMYTVFHRCSALSTGETHGSLSLLSRFYLRQSLMTCSYSRRKPFKHVSCASMSEFEEFPGPFLSLQSSSESDADTTNQFNSRDVNCDLHEENLLAFAKSDSPIQKRNLVCKFILTKFTFL
jgi:hypothetical protein